VQYKVGVGLLFIFCFTKIILLLHTGIGTPSPAGRGTSDEKQQTTSNGGETKKNGNKERKQNETADRRCGTGCISDKEDDDEEHVNTHQMEVEYDKGQEDSDAKSNVKSRPTVASLLRLIRNRQTWQMTLRWSKKLQTNTQKTTPLGRQLLHGDV